MNSSDQGNKQSMYSGNQGSSRSESQGFSDADQEMDIGIEGFSYGEVRRLDRHGRADGNRQSVSEQHDGASRQGGSEQSSS